MCAQEFLVDYEYNTRHAGEPDHAVGSLPVNRTAEKSQALAHIAEEPKLLM
jgi:hypothetical protein